MQTSVLTMVNSSNRLTLLWTYFMEVNFDVIMFLEAALSVGKIWKKNTIQKNMQENVVKDKLLSRIRLKD